MKVMMVERKGERGPGGGEGDEVVTFWGEGEVGYPRNPVGRGETGSDRAHTGSAAGRGEAS